MRPRDDDTCPYCHETIDYQCDEPMGQDETSVDECPHCEKKIAVTCNYTVEYSFGEAGCQNGKKCSRQQGKSFYGFATIDYRECLGCNKKEYRESGKKKRLSKNPVWDIKRRKDAE